MKLINTVKTSKILGVNLARVRSLIKMGYLKDYAETNPTKKKHFSLLDSNEVKEFHRNYKIQYHGVTIRHLISSNGQEVKSNPTEVNLPIPAPPSFKPITLEQSSPVQSFNERLQRIEDKLDTLLRLWS